MVKTERLVKNIIEILDDHKAVDIVSIDLRKIKNSFSSFFIICHGTSNTHVNTLADAVEEEVNQELKEKPYHVEGKNQSQWIIIDYADVIVHIFQKEQRDFYQLEDFWGNGIRKDHITSLNN